MTIDRRSRRGASSRPSTDFTVGLEEEFAILDPETLDLAPRFEELRDAARPSDPVLSRVDRRRADLLRDRDPLRPRARTSPTRSRASATLRRRLFALAARARRRARRDGHAPVGRLPRAAHHRHRALPPGRGRAAVRRAAQQHVLAARPRRRPRAPTAPSASATACARCCRCCWRLSANSPLRRRARHRACTRRARRRSRRASRAAASPTPFGSWAAYRDYIDFLVRTSSIVEYTQVWWSVRPHFTLRHRRGAHLRRAGHRRRSPRRWPR